MTRITSPPVPLMSIIFQLGLTPSLPEMMIGIVLCLSVQHCSSELQRRSLKVLEERSVKMSETCFDHPLHWNLYQSSTTLGLELVSIAHCTRAGSSLHLWNKHCFKSSIILFWQCCRLHYRLTTTCMLGKGWKNREFSKFGQTWPPIPKLAKVWINVIFLLF